MVARNFELTRRAALFGVSAIGLTGLGPAIALAQAPAGFGNTKLSCDGLFPHSGFPDRRTKRPLRQGKARRQFHLVRLAPEHDEGLAMGRWPMTLTSIDTCGANHAGWRGFRGLHRSGGGAERPAHGTAGDKVAGGPARQAVCGRPGHSNYDLIRNKIMRDNGIIDDQYRIEILGNSRVGRSVHRRQS